MTGSVRNGLTMPVLLIMLLCICVESILLGLVQTHTKRMNTFNAPILIHNSIYFDKNSVSLLEKADKYLFTYECFDIQEISAMSNSEYCLISGTNPQLEEIEWLNVKKGRFINEAEYFGGENVCVVSEEVIWRLFGDGAFLGMHIEIYGTLFKIIGICDEITDISHGEKEGGIIYIPYTALIGKSGNDKFKNIIVSAEENYTSVSDMVDEIAALTETGIKNVKHVNLGAYIKLVKSQPYLIIFLVCVILVGIGIKLLFSLVSDIFLEFKKTSIDYYFVSAITKAAKKHRASSTGFLFFALALTAIVGVNMHSHNICELSGFFDARILLKDFAYVFEEFCSFTDLLLGTYFTSLALSVVMIFLLTVILLIELLRVDTMHL